MRNKSESYEIVTDFGPVRLKPATIKALDINAPGWRLTGMTKAEKQTRAGKFAVKTNKGLVTAVTLAARLKWATGGILNAY